MWDKIKYIFYDNGYTKPTTLVDKIRYLIYLKKNPYDLYNVSIKTIELDIVDYINVLNSFIGEDVNNEILTVKNITEESVYTKDIVVWATNNEHILEDIINYMELWLTASLDIVSLYTHTKTNVANVIAQRNSILLKPYIINIELIVDALLEN